MHDATLGMKIVVGPDEIELRKKKAQALVQKITKQNKYQDAKTEELQAKVKKQIQAGAQKAKSKEEAKETDEDMKAVEEALGKRILDRLNGYGWAYGYPIYPYVPYGSPDYDSIAGTIADIYAY